MKKQKLNIKGDNFVSEITFFFSKSHSVDLNPYPNTLIYH